MYVYGPKQWLARAIVALWPLLILIVGGCSSEVVRDSGQVAEVLGATLERALRDGEVGKLAVIDFRNERDEVTPLGESLARAVSQELVQTKRLTLVERSRVDPVLEEQELNQGGLVDSLTAAKLGEWAGADAVLIGDYFEDGRDVRFQVSVIRVETTEILAAATAEIDAQFVTADLLRPKARPPERARVEVEGKQDEAHGLKLKMRWIARQSSLARMTVGFDLTNETDLPIAIGVEMEPIHKCKASLVDDAGIELNPLGNGRGSLIPCIAKSSKADDFSLIPARKVTSFTMTFETRDGVITRGRRYDFGMAMICLDDDGERVKFPLSVKDISYDRP